MSPIDLEDLFERHGPFLRRLARVLVLDEHAAEDLVADTWTAAVSSPPAKLADERSWLSTVLRRRAISLQRRDGLRRPASYESEVTDDLSTVPGSDEVLQRLEHGRLLHAAVTELKEPYRSTVFLRFHEGLAPPADRRAAGRSREDRADATVACAWPATGIARCVVRRPR